MTEIERAREAVENLIQNTGGITDMLTLENVAYDAGLPVELIEQQFRKAEITVVFHD